MEKGAMTMEMKSEIKIIRATLEEEITLSGEKEWEGRLGQVDLYYKGSRVLAVELSLVVDFETFREIKEKEAFGLTESSMTKNLLENFDDRRPVEVVLFLREGELKESFPPGTKNFEEKMGDFINEICKSEGSHLRREGAYEYLKIYQEVEGHSFSGGMTNCKYRQAGSHFLNP